MYSFMRRVLSTDLGRELYIKRRHASSRVRADQTQPRDEPVPTKRQARGAVRVASDRSHPQPPEALQPLDRARHRGPSAPGWGSRGTNPHPRLACPKGGDALASSVSRQPADLSDRCRFECGGPRGSVHRFWKNTPTDVNAFERHYREVHIPLARKLAGLRRYTLSRSASVVRGEEPHYRIAESDWTTWLRCGGHSSLPKDALSPRTSPDWPSSAPTRRARSTN